MYADVAMSSNCWELAIMIGAGEGSVSEITVRSLITHRLHTYVYIAMAIPYTVRFGFIYLQKWLFYCSCTAGHVKMQQTMVISGISHVCALSCFNTGWQCVPIHHNGSLHLNGRGSWKKIPYCINSLISNMPPPEHEHTWCIFAA